MKIETSFPKWQAELKDISKMPSQFPQILMIHIFLLLSEHCHAYEVDTVILWCRMLW